jgi:asparagine synthase (glutamine-hydrolysing)
MLIAIPLFFGCQHLSKIGVTSFFTGGGGPDEILGGYKRHEDIFTKEGSTKTEQLIAQDIKETIPRNLMRDNAIANSFNLNMCLPYLVPTVREKLENLPLDSKIKLQDGKIIRKKFLRDVGIRLGLPKEIVYRPKKAFQYGSNTQKLLERNELQKYIESATSNTNSKS